MGRPEIMISTSYLPNGVSPSSDRSDARDAGDSPEPTSMSNNGQSISGNGSNNTMTTELAARACEKCRSSKRRCDKTLPQCERCCRLNAKCVYLADPVAANSNNPGAPVVVFQSQSLQVVNDVLLRGCDPLEELTAAHILRLVAADAQQPGEKLDWVDGVRSYFNCVHSWYAVVHRTLFEQQIASLWSAADSPVPQVYSPPLTNTPSDKALSVHQSSSVLDSAPEHMGRDLAILIVTMYLTVRLRPNDRTMFDETYRSIKRVLTLSFLDGPVPTLELVQAGALLALYEYGHGDSFAAYRTLSETVAAGRVLGVQPGRLEDGFPSKMLGLADEQNSGLWWAMFILDQFLHRDEVSKNLPFILESPDEQTLLPGSITASQITQHAGGYDVKYLCEPMTPPSRRMSIAVPINATSMESFQLSAKVASLLHRALRHEYDIRTKTPNRLPAVSLFVELDREIRSTTMALLQDDINWQAALDCFAMCVSALFTLYLPFLPVLQSKTAQEINGDYELTTALTALRFAMKMSTDISCKMNGDIAREVNSVRYLAAPAAPTCYLVVMAYAGLRKVFPEQWDQCQIAMMEKYESLKFFSYRWGIAEKIMRQLEDVVGLDRNDFLSGQMPTPPFIESSGPMDLSR
ncbi:uncharacterized protein BCR38DRAFT_139283 [Pseudomassariella vexata]|uniref:Zn(2)-C6 fungal-type domain-containing protein n=1 Tax=Pseudomassariella vexata TaxID=1141098 RepID=A0A1Y2EB62_9PEZI|nr:uncharacterized protein BCR38DRAFT_139283 [Pseudomassariella vexata]ORY68808.1 hypothetical protein BCR38DRAFT_139283 [Pseudomassariella vexata]